MGEQRGHSVWEDLPVDGAVIPGVERELAAVVQMRGAHAGTGTRTRTRSLQQHQALIVSGLWLLLLRSLTVNIC